MDRIAQMGENPIFAARIESSAPVTLQPVYLVDTIAAALPAPSEGAAITIGVTLPGNPSLVRGDAVC